MNCVTMTVCDRTLALAWDTPTRVTRHDLISIWEINMGYRYGRSDINDILIGISIWNMGHRHGIWYSDMVIYHIDISPISIWDILSF